LELHHRGPGRSELIVPDADYAPTKIAPPVAREVGHD
jgi:hypothetical protein